MDVHPPKNGIHRYWSIPKYVKTKQFGKHSKTTRASIRFGSPLVKLPLLPSQQQGPCGRSRLGSLRCLRVRVGRGRCSRAKGEGTAAPRSWESQQRQSPEFAAKFHGGTGPKRKSNDFGVLNGIEDCIHYVYTTYSMYIYRQLLESRDEGVMILSPRSLRKDCKNCSLLSSTWACLGGWVVSMARAFCTVNRLSMEL